MLRPSTDRGMPALGWAARGREVRARTRSITSSIATGPTLQLQPMTSAPQLSIRGVKLSGVEPSRQFPSSSMVTWATTGILGSTSRAARIAWCKFLDVAEGFQHQQVDAAFDQGCDLLAEGGAGFLERGLAQRFNADPQRADRAGHPDVEAFGRFAGQAEPRPG